MRVSKWYTFDASHILPRHKGKCGRLHGHTYEVGIGIEGPITKETQFVLDYNEIDKIVKPLIDEWDHQHLNIFIIYPSAENIATRIGYELWHQLLLSNNEISKFIVSVCETPKTCAIWRSWIDDDRWRLDSTTDIEWKEPEDMAQVTQDVATYFFNYAATQKEV